MLKHPCQGEHKQIGRLPKEGHLPRTAMTCWHLHVPLSIGSHSAWSHFPDLASHVKPGLSCHTMRFCSASACTFLVFWKYFQISECASWMAVTSSKAFVMARLWHLGHEQAVEFLRHMESSQPPLTRRPLSISFLKDRLRDCRRNMCHYLVQGSAPVVSHIMSCLKESSSH